MRPVQGSIVAIVTSALFVPSGALAARKTAAATPAASLFAEGRKLMGDGNYAEACPKLAESESQSPTAVTAMTLATCYEKAGKLATAWSSYKSAADVATDEHKPKPAAVAGRMAEKLESRLSHLTIQVAGDGVEVRLDDQRVQPSALNTPVPRDGGGYDIAVTAAGKKPWRTHVELAQSGQDLSVNVPPLQPLEEEVAAPVVSTASGPDSGSGQTQRIAGVAAAAIGVAGLAVGAVAGVEANSTYHQALTACGGVTVCPAGSRGLSLRESAGTWATASTVAFIAGGAALAGGLVLWLTAPRGKANAGPAMGIAPFAGGTGLSFVGRF
jgi:hypothetical protein